jgi:hypothetical protein
MVHFRLQPLQALVGLLPQIRLPDRRCSDAPTLGSQRLFCSRKALLLALLLGGFGLLVCIVAGHVPHLYRCGDVCTPTYAHQAREQKPWG